MKLTPRERFTAILALSMLLYAVTQWGLVGMWCISMVVGYVLALVLR